MPNANQAEIVKLLSLGLTPGKFRGLQRISNPNGTLTMVATDQNNSMINMFREAFKKQGQEREPTYEEMVEAKIDLARILGPECSGLLVDAYYGAWNVLASGSLPRNTGLLVRLEKSGGTKTPSGAIVTEIEPGWSVAKIKRMGADAVKLLVYFEPEEPESAEKQFLTVEKVYRECQRHDILLVLETVSFPYGGETKKSDSYLNRKPRTVIETARLMSHLCDVYKAEFPGTLGRESEGQLRENLHQLNEACRRPWVLLSAGVDYPEYKQQMELALRCGASGCLGGRAFWKEYFTYTDPDQRRQWLRTEAAKRVREIHDMVQRQGTPWFRRYGLTEGQIASIRCLEGWHFRYAETERPGASGRDPVSPDDVY
ncbi:MAG: tagatose 1,6-diphosphate aldolase [Gemmatales bacterium]|nr:tagatose 1,6-diphosphate aldolase [Gemmatales bacterium]MDW7993529.1 tagatose 1,6-diphosphate aldolase [Gemmatales bacterium]